MTAHAAVDLDVVADGATFDVAAQEPLARLLGFQEDVIFWPTPIAART